MIIIIAIVSLFSKNWIVGLLVGYILIILGETVLFRRAFTGQHFQPRLFWSYKVWDVQKEQIIANILLFIPLGVFTGSLWKWKGILAGAGVSVAIELLQLISRRGLFEFDDILHNTLGAFIGVSFYIFVEIVVKRKRNRDGLKKRS